MYRKEGIFAGPERGLAKLSDTISDVAFCCCKITKNTSTMHTRKQEKVNARSSDQKRSSPTR